MIFTEGEVLDYLNKQGFRIVGNGESKHLSFKEWNMYRNNLIVRTNAGVVIIEPDSKGLKGTYFWKPNRRQLFSRLEVSTLRDGSLGIASPKPIYFGRGSASSDGGYFQDKGYQHILLSRTWEDTYNPGERYKGEELLQGIVG